MNDGNRGEIWMADAASEHGRTRTGGANRNHEGKRPRRIESERGGEYNPWDNHETTECADGKARPVEPGVRPLAHGVPARVGRLRAYGNAIVPQVAAAFIGAFMETKG